VAEGEYASAVAFGAGFALPLKAFSKWGSENFSIEI
jgi:hypothetical protein